MRHRNTSVEFDENCLECVKNKQEKENDNTWYTSYRNDNKLSNSCCIGPYTNYTTGLFSWHSNPWNPQCALVWLKKTIKALHIANLYYSEISNRGVVWSFYIRFECRNSTNPLFKNHFFFSLLLKICKVIYWIFFQTTKNLASFLNIGFISVHKR